MAIYSCLHADTSGPNGTQLRPKAAENETLIRIGELNGRHYYAGLAATEQHTEIDLQTEAMSTEIDALIKQSQLANANKQVLRGKIEHQVGDLHDLLADQAKTIEFLFVLVSRMADDYLGGNAISPAKKAEYLSRVQAVTAALDANAVTLRGDFTNPDAMLAEVMGRTDAINNLVKTEYAEKINALVNA